MSNEFVIMWEEVVVVYFTLLENHWIPLQTSVSIARNVRQFGCQQSSVSSTLTCWVIKKPTKWANDLELLRNKYLKARVENT